MLRKLLSRRRKKSSISAVDISGNNSSSKQRFSITPWNNISSYTRSKRSETVYTSKREEIKEDEATVVTRFSAYIAKLSKTKSSYLHELGKLVAEAAKISQVAGEYGPTNNVHENRKGCFTHELQVKLQKKFQLKFEDMCQEFLDKEGISISEFYSEMDGILLRNDAPTCQEVLDEETQAILNLIQHATSFDYWIMSLRIPTE